MANSSEILESLLRDPPPSDGPVTYQWLLPNMKGLENFLRVLDSVPSSSSSHDMGVPPPRKTDQGSTMKGDTGPALNTSSYDANAMPDSTSGVSAMSFSSTLSNTSNIQGDTGPAQNTSTYDANAMPDSTSGTTTTTPTSPSHPTSHSPTHEISLFTSATEAFSQRNTNKSIADSLSLFRTLIGTSQSHISKPRIRAYISVALGCPFTGPAVDPHAVASITSSLLSLGADTVCIADTTGMGTAPSTRRLLKTLKAAGIRAEDLALHFHDTYGMALVNCLVGLEEGVREFDGAVAGLGGCPFSPGATGNVGTEDLIHLFEGLGVEVEGGPRLRDVAETGEWVSGVLGRGSESRAGRAVLGRERARL
ncbi:MAG: hypothetical protein M1828_005623 [Chrysothrix sp. TS-e1954]|nr:MAG: hypothetical protein M1828_005623 [Chrysothrix sp. TS-e1954]